MSRVILFGLDGAAFPVLDRLIADGVMPSLDRFLRNGARGILQSTVPPLTPPAWCTLVTGRSPGHHGITGFFQYESDRSLSLEIVSANKLACPTLWSIVNGFGSRAGSLNFPAHHPAPKIEGYVIPGWIPKRWLRRFSHPSDLIARLGQAIPGFDVGALAMDFDEERKSVAGQPVEDPEKWIALHLERERQWFSVFEHQWREDRTELTGVVFDGVDKIQHLLWPYLDPDSPIENTSEHARIRDLCRAYFRQIDTFLAKTLEMAGPDTTVLIVSDHGFTGTGDIVYINTWLERRGYLAWNGTAELVEDGSQELEPDFYKLSAFDTTRTRAFALTASSNGINIMVRGRKTPHGIPPENYLVFRDQLVHELLTDCTHPDTGRPLVEAVSPREEVFAGPHMGVAPDLTLTLSDHGFVSVRRSNTVAKRRAQPMGTHHPEGILAAAGPGIRAGVRIEPSRLVDIAPTVLYCMGLPAPEDLEGCNVREIFTAAHLATHSPRTGERTLAAAASGGDPAGEPGEDAAILERLIALGYLE